MSDDVAVLLKTWANNTEDGMQRTVLLKAVKEIAYLRKLLKKTEYVSNRVFEGKRPLTKDMIEAIEKRYK